jgi:hypothetical protein
MAQGLGRPGAACAQVGVDMTRNLRQAAASVNVPRIRLAHGPRAHGPGHT